MGTRFDQYGYGPVFGIYDPLASLYSRGRIAQTKACQADFISGGDRVLYPGIGRGSEAVSAAQSGATVVGLDVSERMLAGARARFAAAGLEASFMLGDAALHEPTAPYDVIAAHYFLNLFEASRAKEMLDRFADWLRPGGRLLLADFARPTGSALGRLVSEAYYRPVNAIAWSLGLCAWHPILDYAELLRDGPFRIIAERRFPVLFGENPAYISVVAERTAV